MKVELMELIHLARLVIMDNNRWMTWNLLLALIPLAISFWLFYWPRSRWLRWGVFLLMGATWIPFYGSYNYGNLNKLKPAVHRIHSEMDSIDLGIDTSYLVGAIALTLVLMGLDIFWLRLRGTRSLLWWVGLLVFIGFLPNAPYVLTDILHFYENLKWYHSVWVITLVVIPQYLLFMIVGFEAYVLSLIYVGYYLKGHGLGKFILWVELILHGLSTVGIYLGRFKRLNSWHILTKPDDVVMSVFNDLTEKRPALVMAVTFLVIAVLYWLFKQMTLAILYWQSRARTSAGTSESDLPTAQS
ncbi:DUF1361 domain-containing protein [Kamptonema formosum]|uniref:DUF1361 domain-containing protein n=1 Tax=Kamptonema formosum TaxID=331992 RepID=UPI0003483F83|nr:DUF1361 domain-containing protein [Oscillatoria sp. PCC 10802]